MLIELLKRPLHAIVDQMGKYPARCWDFQEFDDPTDWIPKLKVLPPINEVKLLFAALHTLTADIATLTVVIKNIPEPDDEGDERDDNGYEVEVPKTAKPVGQKAKRSAGPFKLQNTVGMVFNDLRVSCGGLYLR